MRGRILVLSLVAMVVAAGCSGTPDGDDAGQRTLAYMKIYAETGAGKAHVGWLEKRQKVDPDGIRTTVDFVKNLDFDIRGYLRSEGTAVKYVDMAPAMESAVGVERKYDDLPRASREHLVRMILDLPVTAKVSFVTATVADIRR